MRSRLPWVSVAWLALGASVWGCGSDPVDAGWALFGDGRADEARAVFEAAADGPSGRGAAQMALGELALLATDLEVAADHFTTAAAVPDQRAGGLAGYGEALLRSGRAREAYEALLEAIDLGPSAETVVRIGGLTGDAYATRRLTASRWDNYAPTFSPDGRSVVFTSHQTGNGELTRVDVESLATELLIELPDTNEYGACYSRSGQLLVFGSVQHHSLAGIAKLHGSGSGTRNEILYVSDVASGERVALNASPGPVGNPSFSADGSTVLFEAIVERNLDVWAMDVDGRNRRRLTTEAEDDGQPVAHPDGTSIVFLRRLDERFDLMSMAVDGTNVEQVTRTPFHEYAGTFSPDGRLFVYVRQVDGNLG